ncbi:M15 family peptidase [bacterium]|nr:M15 family peptidase [bacterium]
MPKFSLSSQIRLFQCQKDLQFLFNEVIKHQDCTILVGYRNEAAQNAAYKEGKSQLKYPESKHNKDPSLAVDVAPYPIDWNNIDRFIEFGKFVIATAKTMKSNKLITYDIRWGGDWDGDGDLADQKMNDYVHFEIVK